MPEHPTLKGKNLSLDLLAALVIALVIMVVGWNLYNNFKDRFISVNVTDAGNVNIFIDSELANAQNKLELFTLLGDQDRVRITHTRFQSFSDLYALDTEGRVTRIYKSAPESQLFVGYQFSAGPVRQELLNQSANTAISSIVQGHEDGLPSVYILYRDGNQAMLGRLNLDYVRSFISQYAQITGNVLLITTEHGVVMVSSRPDATIPSIAPQIWENQQPAPTRIEALGKGWIPVATDSPVLGAKLVVLVPTSLLDQQRTALVLGLAVVLIALALVVLLKNHKLRQDVLQPIAALIQRIRAMEAGQPVLGLSKPADNLPAEFIEIDRRFESMTMAIGFREKALQTAAQELQQRETELSLILQHVPIPLIVFNNSVDLDINFINETFIEVFGYDAEQVRSLSELFEKSCQEMHTAHRIHQQIVEMVRRHQQDQVPPQPIEVSIDCRSGVKHDVIIAAIALDDTAIATFVDVTPLRTSQRELMQAKLQAEHQEQQKSEFLAMMSHEIRTPLTSILGITELFGNQALDERQRDLVSRLSDTSHLLLRIINDVLDHSKIEAGELRIDAKPFNPNLLLRKCERMFSDLCTTKGIVLSVDVAPECDVQLLGDTFRIEQVLSNLVGNAVKFTEEGSVRVALQCQAVSSSDMRIRIDVCDTGIGIPESLQGEIFSPFQQGNRDIAQRFGGTGLGLSISKRLVELMGGTIDFESVAGRGSTFSFELSLPIIAGEATDTDIKPKRYSENTALLLNHKHVLIVDDSQALQFLLQEMLEPLEVVTSAALDGQQAIELLRQSERPIDLVLMDIQMPVMDGIECTRLIRQTRGLEELPIIAMTAGLPDWQKADIIAAGANTILAKPIQTETLIQTLADYLEESIRQAFPTIIGINQAHAMQTMNHRPAFFKRLLKIFIEENQSTAELTMSHIDQGHYQEAAQLMHRLRGSAGQLGALDIAAAAQSIEETLQAGTSPSKEALESLDASLTQMFDSANAALAT